VAKILLNLQSLLLNLQSLLLNLQSLLLNLQFFYSFIVVFLRIFTHF